MSVKMMRAYVVVDSSGFWVTRPLGSAKAAIKNLNSAREKSLDMNCSVVEIMTAHEVANFEIKLRRNNELPSET